MEPSILIPTPDPIPVPWGWFKFFLLSTFMAHILLMNVMVGTGIIVFFSHLRKDSQKHLEPLERDISKKLTFIIAFAVNFGVAPLLFLQVLYGHFVYVSSMLMGVYWLSIFVLLIIAYYSAYYYKLRFDALRTARIYLIGMAVLILLVIGFFFTNNMTLMLTPETWTRYFENPEGTLLNLSDSTLFPRFLHFMTASVAIGGLFIAITWSLKEKKEIPGSQENVDRRMRWFTIATVVQIAIGVWFLFSLPWDIRSLFIGGSQFHTSLLMISVGLVATTLILGVYRNVWPATVSTLALVLIMIIMRDSVRTAYLKPFFEVSQLRVIHQYSPMIFFMAALIVGLGIVAYVIRLGMRCPAAEDSA